MPKMNYSNFREDEYEIIPAGTAEVLSRKPTCDLSSNASNGSVQALANAVSPAAAFTSCINNMFNIISTISKCVAAVSIEKQRTEQVRLETKAKIAESKEQTERVRIREREETQRLIVKCEADLKAKKIELEKLRAQYKSEDNKRKTSYKEFVKSLEILEKQADDLMADKDLLRNIILKESSLPQIEIYLHSLNDINTKLVEISQQVVSLKGM